MFTPQAQVSRAAFIQATMKIIMPPIRRIARAVGTDRLLSHFQQQCRREPFKAGTTPRHH